MKIKLIPTQNDLREKTRRAMIKLLNQQLADVLDLGFQAKQAH
jgi:DNA-binding ferritin-like protein